LGKDLVELVVQNEANLLHLFEEFCELCDANANNKAFNEHKAAIYKE